VVSPSIIILEDVLARETDRKDRKLTWRYRSNDALLLLWASRASIPAFSSYRLHEYHAVPCSLQGPMHTQQNSCLHFLQVMWLELGYRIGKCVSINFEKNSYLQPPFFSIVLWHCGHSLVLDLIQLAVSLSSRHFLSHILATAQIRGRWSLSIGQPKQNLCSLPCKPGPICWLLLIP
jgi:hypothetical protein